MPDLPGSTVLRRVDRVVQAEVDGDLVLMSPRDFAYFGTEGAGEPVWALIDGERLVREHGHDANLRGANLRVAGAEPSTSRGRRPARRA